MTKTLIKGGTVITAVEQMEADVLVDGGQVVALLGREHEALAALPAGGLQHLGSARGQAQAVPDPLHPARAEQPGEDPPQPRVAPAEAITVAHRLALQRQLDQSTDAKQREILRNIIASRIENLSSFST